MEKLKRGRFLRLGPGISDAEVALAAKDVPKNNAAGLDILPSEVCANCAEMHAYVAGLFNSMIQRNYVPKALRRFFIILMDKPGADPTTSSNKRSIASRGPHMKLLESVLVRHIQQEVRAGPSEVQYAFQRARSTEIMLLGLDHLVSESRAEERYTYVVGLRVAGAFDSASLSALIEAAIFSSGA